MDFLTKTHNMPSGLHEVLGHEQSILSILMIVILTALGTTSVAINFGPILLSRENVSWARYVVGLVVAADVFAGAMANYTQGTNNFYASKPRARWLFIVIHWHLVVVALLWDERNMLHVGLFNFAIFVCGSLVNLARETPHQIMKAGGLNCVLQIGLLVYQPISPPLMPVASLLAIKVVHSFALDHYRKS